MPPITSAAAPAQQSSPILHAVFAAADGFTLKTHSRAVAEAFGRRHDDVLKAIRSVDCSSEFSVRNFAEASYFDAQGKTRPMVEMTFDGFIFLVMGFTGARAAAIKEAYIAEFNRMRSQLAGIERAQHAAQVAELRSQAAYYKAHARLPVLPLTERTRERIHELLAQRMSVADIARICRCSRQTVRLLRETAAASADLFAQ